MGTTRHTVQMKEGLLYRVGQNYVNTETVETIYSQNIHDMCKMIHRTVSTCSPSCLTHNNQRATVPFKARTHISRGTDDTAVRILTTLSISVNILLTNPVFQYCRGLLLHLTPHTHTHSARFLWTRDRPVAETSAWKHTTLTRDRHPCPRRDSNSKFQQASGHRHTP
jgi:hypothetical protein